LVQRADENAPKLSGLSALAALNFSAISPSASSQLAFRNLGTSASLGLVLMSGFLSLSGLLTNSYPNRPLIHKLPSLTPTPEPEVTFTTRPSLVFNSMLQPTPQYVQVVEVFSVSHRRPAPRAFFSTSAPTGQASMHWPQTMHFSLSGSGYHPSGPGWSSRRPNGFFIAPYTWTSLHAA
jgi:hypothetical protein